MGALQGILVAHTHWDRAWYLPFEGYRIHLVRLVDQVLDLLAADPDYHSFTLDGQTVLLDDYHRIRPERWPEIQTHVRSGRLEVGPFFVLPDEFLVSGEALIRNLQRGIRRVRELGGDPTEGYLPDSFGHIAQMPQLLQGFGLRSFLFMRGMSQDLYEQAGVEFWWQAPDGSRVLALYLQGGYDHLSALGHPARFGNFRGQDPDPTAALELVQSALDLLAPKVHSGVILLCNGGDHMPPQPEIAQLLTILQTEMPTIEFQQGSYRESTDRILEASPLLTTYQGELLGNVHHPVLSGVWSARIHLKLINQRVQSCLEKIAEPLVAALGQAGIRFVAHIEEAWRHLLLCHPHDDICGCSLDQAHEDNLFHFRQAETAAEAVIADALQMLALQSGLSSDPIHELIAVFNPHPWAVEQSVSLEVLWTGEPLLDASTLRLIDPTGSEVSARIRIMNHNHAQARHLSYQKGQQLTLSFLADLPATGLSFYRLTTGSVDIDRSIAQRPPALPERKPTELENEHYRIRVDDTGSITIEHKPTGQSFVDAVQFEWMGDEGDLYSFSPAQDPGEEPIQTQQFIVQRSSSQTSKLTIRYRWTLTTEESIELTLEITLSDPAHRVEFVAHVNNQMRDHRLRILLPLGGCLLGASADSHFSIQHRQKPEILTPEEAPERYGIYPGELNYPTQFSQEWIHARHPDYGVLICHRGLHEYELIHKTEQAFCALTLLRCVGVLSREGGRIRRVQAGSSLQTPAAQCQGNYTFQFAWQLTDPQLSAVDVAPLASPFVHPLQAAQVWIGSYERPSDYPVPLTYSLVQLDNLLLSLSALKLNPDGSWVVRVFNRSEDLQLAQLRLTDPKLPPLQKVEQCNLNEEGLESLDFRDQTVRVRVDPFQIVTLAFRFS